jgi:hypothetical protein
MEIFTKANTEIVRKLGRDPISMQKEPDLKGYSIMMK